MHSSYKYSIGTERVLKTYHLLMNFALLKDNPSSPAHLSYFLVQIATAFQ